MAAAIPRHLLETLINCPSCSVRYINPRVLPSCGHTICSICLENEWNDQYKHYCPVKSCRKEICLTIHSPSDLPLNQTVIDLLKSCNFHVEANGECEVCHQSPSFVKCSHCCLFVCFECANEHRRETLTTLTNHINTLEQDYLNMNDQIDHARKTLNETREKSLDSIRISYTNFIEQIRHEQMTNEEFVERQSISWNNQLENVINEYKQRYDGIAKNIEDLRITITDWSTVEQFKQLQIKLNHVQENIRQANENFRGKLPEMKIFQVEHEDLQKRKKKINQIDSPSQTDELILANEKSHPSLLSGSIKIQHLDDSTSSASSSSNNEPIIKPTNGRTISKHPNGKGNHYKSLNTLAHPSNSPRIHRIPAPLPNKTISNSMADLSLSMHSNKTRLPTFASKLDHYNSESLKKIPLSQNYDWGMLAITNTDLILIYNKDKSSLVVYDANGNENERIQWSDGEIKDLCIYHDDSIIIIGEHKQTGVKPLECKLYICSLTRKQLERERIVERGLNCQRVASDEKSIFYGSEKGCNKSKIFIYDQDLQLQSTFEAGVEIRSLAVDSQSCYILGKRREREAGRYFLEKRQKNGHLIRRVDLYELNMDNMNRIIIDPISHGVIVTDGGNKKLWAIGSDGEKKSIQYRPWPWSTAFLRTDILVILHAGCLTFHTIHQAKQMNNGTKIRHVVTNTEKV